MTAFRSLSFQTAGTGVFPRFYSGPETIPSATGRTHPGMFAEEGDVFVKAPVPSGVCFVGSGETGGRGLKTAGRRHASAADLTARTAQIDISSTRGIRYLLDPHSGVGQETELERLIHKMLPLYYQGLDSIDQKKIEAALLELPEDVSDEDQLFAILQASGPAIQKLFQLYGHKMGSDKLRNTLGRLQDSLKPFSIDHHKAQIEREMGTSFRDVFSEFDESPVGVGTVAQVHRAVIRDRHGLEVAVAIKLRRPDYHEVLAREFTLLERIVNDDFGKQIVEKLREKTFSEGDFQHEVEGVKRALSYDTARSVSLIAGGLLPVLDDVFGMRWVEGVTFSKIGPETKDQLLARFEALTGVYSEWVSRAFLGDHFFHGDPHGGNLSYNNRSHPKICYLDFGNWTELLENAVKPFATLSQAVAMKSQDLATEAFEALYGKKLSQTQNSLLGREFGPAVSGNSTIVERVSNLFAVAARIGIDIPASAISLQRGMMLFDFEFKSMRAKLGEFALTQAERENLDRGGSDSVNIDVIKRVLGAQLAVNAARTILGALFGRKQR